MNRHLAGVKHVCFERVRVVLELGPDVALLGVIRSQVARLVDGVAQILNASNGGVDERLVFGDRLRQQLVFLCDVERLLRVVESGDKPLDLLQVLAGVLVLVKGHARVDVATVHLLDQRLRLFLGNDVSGLVVLGGVPRVFVVVHDKRGVEVWMLDFQFQYLDLVLRVLVVRRIHFPAVVLPPLHVIQRILCFCEGLLVGIGVVSFACVEDVRRLRVHDFLLPLRGGASQALHGCAIDLDRVQNERLPGILRFLFFRLLGRRLFDFRPLDGPVLLEEPGGLGRCVLVAYAKHLSCGADSHLVLRSDFRVRCRSEVTDLRSLLCLCLLERGCTFRTVCLVFVRRVDRDLFDSCGALRPVLLVLVRSINSDLLLGRLDAVHDLVLCCAQLVDGSLLCGSCPGLPGLLCHHPAHRVQALVLDLPQTVVVRVKRRLDLRLQTRDLTGRRRAAHGTGQAHVLQAPIPGVVLLTRRRKSTGTVAGVLYVVLLGGSDQGVHLRVGQVPLVSFNDFVVVWH